MDIEDREDETKVDFVCGESFAAKWINRCILDGRTYPLLPFVDDVRVVLDIGANCGAFSVHVARHHPGAQVHAFEPASEPFGYLSRNVADLPNVTAHRIGLHDHDAEVPFYLAEESINGSISSRPGVATGGTETVQLRDAAAWTAEHGIDRADIVKLDVEGCETEVLRSLEPLLPTVKVLYVEYDSRRARRELFSILDATHELYWGALMVVDQGECVFVRADYADHPDVPEHLRMLFSRVAAGQGAG